MAPRVFDARLRTAQQPVDACYRRSCSLSANFYVMAAASDENKHIDNDDAALDFCSANFDPTRALREAGVVPPVADAVPLDNLAVYETRRRMMGENDDRPLDRQQRPLRKERKQQNPAPNSNLTEAGPSRKWLPHQLPVTRKRVAKNIYTRMEVMLGPLTLLKKCVDQHLRIKVWTRHSHDIRGYCTGYVKVFDNHFNMVLEEVIECWTRKKRRKVPAGEDSAGGFQEAASFSREKVKVPQIKVVASDKKTESCERYVDKFMMRGEHVALIAVL